MELNINVRHLSNQGVVETRLSEEIVSNLWTLINEAKEQPEDMNFNLKGNISPSLRLDGDSPLLDDLNQRTIKSLINESILEFGAPNRNWNSLSLQQMIIDE